MTDPKGNDRRIVQLSAGGRQILDAFKHTQHSLNIRQLQFGSFGVRIFKRYKHGYLAASGSAWRPCQEGAEWLGSVCSRRRLLVTKATLLKLAEQRKLPLEEFVKLLPGAGAGAGEGGAGNSGGGGLKSAPLLLGWETVCPPGLPATPESIPELGGVCIGVIPGEGGVVGGSAADMATDRLWLACAITRTACECFASKLEVGGLIARLRGELGLQVVDGEGDAKSGAAGAAAAAGRSA